MSGYIYQDSTTPHTALANDITTPNKMPQIVSESALADPYELASNAFVENCIGISLFALAVLEHILTISKEISFVWRWRNLTRFTIFLLLLRYSILAYAGVSVASIFVTESETCTLMVGLSEGLAILLMTFACVGSAWRVYALCRSHVLVAAILLFGMAPVFVNINSVVHSAKQTTQLPEARCLTVWTFSEKSQYTSVIIARLSTAVADMIVFIVTFMKTISGVRSAASLNIRVPIIWILLRDGTIYFFVACVMNLVQIVLYVILRSVYITPFICVVTPIILSRQFLNIRGAAVAASASRDYNLTPSVPSWPSIIVFGDYGDGPRPHFQAFWSDSETYAADENDFDLTTDSWQTYSF